MIFRLRDLRVLWVSLLLTLGCILSPPNLRSFFPLSFNTIGASEAMPKVSGHQSADPCTDAASQQELNACAVEQFEKAEAELNRTYRRIASRLGPRHRADLRQSQRAWLKYRDLNCKAESGFRSGSLAPAVQAFCLQSSNASRTKELLRIYELSDE